MNKSITLLKLGGSLITDKSKPFTPQINIIKRIAKEISIAFKHDSSLKLIIGHGSGSFGHIPAKKYNTRLGVTSSVEWAGFIEVWKEARHLNQIVLATLIEAGLPTMTFPPSSSIITENGKVISWDLRPLSTALNNGLIPLVYGDVVFDEQIGGTILSTEELFLYLAKQLNPKRILIAGKEQGVWIDFPKRTKIIKNISPGNFQEVLDNIGQSYDIDVTGGMIQKVTTMLNLIGEFPEIEAIIFSGEEQQCIQNALLGESPGTRIFSG